MESNDVLMVPYSVLDGPIVLNIHVGPIPRLAGIGRSNGGAMRAAIRTFDRCSPMGFL